jgi:hypothetical protein
MTGFSRDRVATTEAIVRGSRVVADVLEMK